MNTSSSLPALVLTAPPEHLAGFASLLQHGILFPVEQPIQIRTFLLALPGFSAEYIENTVQTIFVNGSAADSFQALLTAGSTLALSAAMPGLAGAIFRREGMHGSLRSQPTPGSSQRATEGEHGYLTLKLFNAIAQDRVTDLLSQGIVVTGSALCSFAQRQATVLQPPLRLVFAGQEMDAAMVVAAVQELPLLRIQWQA